jgi:hypothetical protein
MSVPNLIENSAVTISVKYGLHNSSCHIKLHGSQEKTDYTH